MIRAEFNGIVQQIMEHLLDLFHICPGVQLFPERISSRRI